MTGDKDDTNGAPEPPGEERAGLDRPPDLEAQVRALEAELESARDEARSNFDRYVRERADLENFKKRAAREREDTVRYGTEALVRALLPVLDNLERAVAHAAAGGNGQPLLEGVTMVLKGFREALEQHGVRAVNALGERFDPALHEAMEQVDSADHAPNTVVREHQRGYQLHDRLIRPALVGVSRAPTGGQSPHGKAGGS